MKIVKNVLSVKTVKIVKSVMNVKSLKAVNSVELVKIVNLVKYVSIVKIVQRMQSERAHGIGCGDIEKNVTVISHHKMTRKNLCKFCVKIKNK